MKKHFEETTLNEEYTLKLKNILKTSPWNWAFKAPIRINNIAKQTITKYIYRPISEKIHKAFWEDNILLAGIMAGYVKISDKEPWKEVYFEDPYDVILFMNECLVLPGYITSNDLMTLNNMRYLQVTRNDYLDDRPGYQVEAYLILEKYIRQELQYELEKLTIGEKKHGIC